MRTNKEVRGRTHTNTDMEVSHAGVILQVTEREGVFA